ncbi:hypothetical protein K8R66_01775 [bacterium]|nr:hypothetical protein [bacterium]
MEVIILTKDKYKDWDNFCLKSDDAWFWHTSQWLEYNLNFKPENNSKSNSFYVINNKQIIAICPLILENYNGVNEFRFGHYPGPAPAFYFDKNLTEKSKNKIMKIVFNEVDRLAQENNVQRSSFRFSVLNKSYVETQKQKYNYLMKFGYLDISFNTHIIDLNKSIEELRSEVRHGHDYDIDLASKQLKLKIFDQNNINQSVFDKYVDLHLGAADIRKNRPKKTFDIMFNLIEENKAFLVGALKNDKFIGFSYFFLYKNNIYYGSSCNNPEMRDIPIAHFIQWKAIEYMKNQKYNFYEIGWQYFLSTLSYISSSKEEAIARFKRGFGGYTVPLFVGEKYYSQNYFLKIHEDRLNKFKDKILLIKK